MGKGAAAKDKKSAEKKGGDKGKGKTEEAADKGGKVRTYWSDLHPCGFGFVVLIRWGSG